MDYEILSYFMIAIIVIGGIPAFRGARKIKKEYEQTKHIYRHKK